MTTPTCYAAPLLLLLSILPALGCNTPDDPAPVELPAEPYMFTPTVHGEERRAWVHPPTVGEDGGEPGGAVPVVLYFHGRGGDVEDSADRRKFHELWPQAVVVYMEGSYVNAWGADVDPSDVDEKLGWTLRFPYKYALGQSKDIAYVKLVLDHLDGTFDVEDVFACGHSSGGFFTLSLMELMPAPFRAFAVLGAYARYEVADASSISNGPSTPVDLDPVEDVALHPRPLLYVFGTEDDVFEGDAGTQGWPGWSADPSPESLSRSTLRQVMIRNRCEEPSDPYWADLDRRVFEPVDPSGAELHWQLYEGGHSWPSEANGWVVEFFREF